MASRRGPAGDLQVVVGWLALLWVIYIIQLALWNLAGYSLVDTFGLWPRKLHGLIGILTAHFLHGSLAHIAANSIGLLILGWASCGYSRALTGAAVGYAMLCAGFFTWCFGSWNHPSEVHVGASGVIFGLMGFLLANGLFRRDLFAIFLGLATLVLFGSGLTAALPPTLTHAPTLQVSWEMHLGGFVGGILASWQYRRAKKV
ncbi:MAG: rhomboid family intramembrane serine protease [Planctomycetes bacterium]|nr:rhomboid family intramembrane serine protease [Planctomycetota bacterium]